MFNTVTAFPSWLYVGERNHVSVHNIPGVISMWSCSCYVPCHVLFHPWMQSNGSHYKMGVLGNRPHLLLTELQRGDASRGGREPPRLYIYFRAGEGRNGLQQHGCPLWSISLFYIVSQQMGWGEKVASKEQTPPHVGNARESEAAGVWWACPPTLHPLLAKKHASTMFISDSQLKVIVDVRLTGLFWSILTPIPIRHADVLGARKTSATARLSFALARIISWGIQWSAKTHRITSPGMNACGGCVSRH